MKIMYFHVYIGVTLLVYCHHATVEPPTAVPGSLFPTGEILPDHTQWSLRFDKEVKCHMYMYIHVLYA